MIRRTVHDAILTTWPGRVGREELGDDQPLGSEGLGLDSVEMVELLLICEEACHVRATEELFSASSLTVGQLVDHLATRP